MSLKNTLKIVTLSLVVGVSVSYISAYTSPTCSPPNCNTPAPLNVSANGQSKVGWMWINGTDAAGTALARSLTVQNGQVQIGTTTANTALLLAVNGQAGIMGNVGIGTMSPTYPLTIYSPAEFGTVFTGGVVSGSYRFTGFGIGQSIGAGTAGNIGYMTHQTNTALSGTYITNYGEGEGSSGLFVKKGGNVGVNNVNPISTLDVVGTANISSYLVTPHISSPSNLLLDTANNAGTINFGNSVMTITSAGNVGINATNPTVPLEVHGFISGSGGVFGLASASYNSYGVLGQAIASGQVGVKGTGWGAGAPGVLGTNTGGNAVQGSCTGGNCWGVYGDGNGTGGGVYSNGKLYVASGGATITGATHIAGNPANFYVDAGAGYASAGFYTGSDRRLKTDIQPVTNALDTISKFNPVSYKWIKPEDHANQTGTQFGFIAQEVEQLYPSWVMTNPDGYKALNYTQFISLSVEAVKELDQKNKDLEKKNAELEVRIKAIEDKLK